MGMVPKCDLKKIGLPAQDASARLAARPSFHGAGQNRLKPWSVAAGLVDPLNPAQEFVHENGSERRTQTGAQNRAH
jgi:hypothetical protein